MKHTSALVTHLFLGCFLYSVATAAPNPGGPFFWPLGKQTPKPHGYNDLKHDPPFNHDQCATLAEPFKSRLEDCLWVPYGYGADCVRTKLTEKEYEIYNSLYHWGCIVPGVSGQVDPNFVRRHTSFTDDEKETHKTHAKETALPPLDHYTKKKSKKLVPQFTREQCQHIEKSFKSRTIACGLKPKARRYACVASNLDRRQWRSFKEAVQRGCEFPWMKGDTRGQLLSRRDRGKPDTHRPPWMSSWNGDHWDAWEKYENVKLKDFVINKLDFLTPDIPADWLLHYPFSGGKGRVGKWNEEHPKDVIDISREGKHRSWDAVVKRSASKKSTNDGATESARHPLMKRQRLLPPDPSNPGLTRASQHNNNVPEIPDWEREGNAVPTFEGRRCYIVNEYDQHVTYEEAKKDENGYVRVKCVGPEISSPDEHYHKQDYTEPVQKRENMRVSANEGHGTPQASENEERGLAKRQFLPPPASDPIWTKVMPYKFLTMIMDAHKNEFRMGRTHTYGKSDWQATHKEHWAEQPVYFKNHQLGRDCYNMNFHYTTMTCYFMWKPGSG